MRQIYNHCSSSLLFICQLCFYITFWTAQYVLFFSFTPSLPPFPPPKVMASKMRKHIKANEVDMVFDVILNKNIQQARDDDTDGGNDVISLTPLIC